MAAWWRWRPTRPTPRAAENCELNALPQVQAVHAAVARRAARWRSAATARSTTAAAAGATGRSRPTRSMTLAQALREPDVVFIDVEGYELEALPGSPRDPRRRPGRVRRGPWPAAIGDVRRVVNEGSPRPYETPGITCRHCRTRATCGAATADSTPSLRRSTFKARRRTL